MRSRSFEHLAAPLDGGKGCPEPRNELLHLAPPALALPSPSASNANALTACLQALVLSSSCRLLRRFPQLRGCGVTTCNDRCCLCLPLFLLRSEEFLPHEFVSFSPAQSHERRRDCGGFSDEMSLSSPFLVDLQLNALHTSNGTPLSKSFESRLKRGERGPHLVHFAGLECA